jgi:hypothetical protein
MFFFTLICLLWGSCFVYATYVATSETGTANPSGAHELKYGLL